MNNEITEKNSIRPSITSLFGKPIFINNNNNNNNNESNMSWINKYKPKNLAEIIGNQENIKKINDFLKPFIKKLDITQIKNPNIIISGGNGTGKTLISELAIRENGFEIIHIDLSKLKNKKKKKTEDKSINEKEKKNISRSVETYYKYLENKMSMSLSGKLTTTRFVVFFDDVPNITNSKEKDVLCSLVKINNKLKKFPIIITANNKHDKKLNDLKKMIYYSEPSNETGKKKKCEKISNEIIMEAPPMNELIIFLNKLCNLEKIKFQQNRNNIFIDIIDHAQGDNRRLINMIEQIKYTYGDEIITSEMFEKYTQTSVKKDLDPGIFEATRMLLNNYSCVNDALALYCEDRSTIPLMVHENYPRNIYTQYPQMQKNNQIDLLFKISKCMSESDRVEGLIYSNQSWSLQSVHGFYSCVLPSYHINENNNKLCNKEFYDYTQDYNKTSIKKINQKVIKKAKDNKCLRNVGINDFLYMSSILKSLIKTGNLELIAKLMEPYKLKVKEIESIIKIDKMEIKDKDKDKIFTTKQKTALEDMPGIVKEKKPEKKKKPGIRKSITKKKSAATKSTINKKSAKSIDLPISTPTSSEYDSNATPITRKPIYKPSFNVSQMAKKSAKIIVQPSTKIKLESMPKIVVKKIN